jgi:serine/threonine protein kinase
VHRDIKPSNIIFCEEHRSLRLIDLGAMADLRTGVNYRPDESILDPYYCPPEQYVLPTDAPDLASKSRVMSLAISSMLWNKHKPDRFDMYSVGLIFLQLAMPHLRTKSALQVCSCLSLLFSSFAEMFGWPRALLDSSAGELLGHLCWRNSQAALPYLPYCS